MNTGVTKPLCLDRILQLITSYLIFASQQLSEGERPKATFFMAFQHWLMVFPPAVSLIVPPLYSPYMTNSSICLGLIKLPLAGSLLWLPLKCGTFSCYVLLSHPASSFGLIFWVLYFPQRKFSTEEISHRGWVWEYQLWWQKMRPGSWASPMFTNRSVLIYVRCYKHVEVMIRRPGFRWQMIQ